MSVCQEWTEAYSLVKVGREGGDEEGGPREDLEERKGAQGEGHLPSFLSFHFSNSQVLLPAGN